MSDDRFLIISGLDHALDLSCVEAIMCVSRTTYEARLCLHLSCGSTVDMTLVGEGANNPVLDKHRALIALWKAARTAGARA